MAVGFPFYATGHPRHARQFHAMPESLRPATTADRLRRSAGRHPHIRAPAARRHRNAPRMPGHSAPPARRRPAPMGCGAPVAGWRGGRGRRSRRRAGVVPRWTRCRAPGSARTRGCSPGPRAGALFRRLGGGTAEQGVGVGFQQGTGVFVSGIVDGAGHGGTSWRLRPCGPCSLGRSPAPTVQSISPSAPPLNEPPMRPRPPAGVDARGAPPPAPSAAAVPAGLAGIAPGAPAPAGRGRRDGDSRRWSAGR